MDHFTGSVGIGATAPVWGTVAPLRRRRLWRCGNRLATLPPLATQTLAHDLKAATTPLYVARVDRARVQPDCQSDVTGSIARCEDFVVVEMV